MCGASGELKSAYETAKSTASTMLSDFNQVFAGNMNILDNLKSVLTPMTLPGQFGYTPQETAAKQSEASASIAAAGRQAAGKTGEALAAVGGGNSVLPSGSKDAILGQQAEQVAQAQAKAQQDIITSGYDVGRQQQQFAIDALAKAPGELENPATAMEDQLVSANNAAAGLGKDVTAANRAWEKPVMGLIGGALDVATAGLSGVAGKIGDVADSAAHSLA